MDSREPRRKEREAAIKKVRLLLKLTLRTERRRPKHSLRLPKRPKSWPSMICRWTTSTCGNPVPGGRIWASIRC